MGICGSSSSKDNNKHDEHAILGAKSLPESGVIWKNRPPRCGVWIPCLVHRVIDGDTLDISYLLNPLFIEQSYVFRGHLRLKGIDTPEIRGETELERRVAQRCKSLVQRWVMGPNVRAFVRIEKWDKYGGRFVGEIKVGETDIAQKLLQLNLAHPFTGREKKSAWTEEELANNNI